MPTKKIAKKAAKKQLKKAAKKPAKKVVKSVKKTVKKAKKVTKKVVKKAPKAVTVQAVTDPFGIVTMRSIDDPGTSSEGQPATVTATVDKATGVVTMVPNAS